jgi:hypothetical protein
VDITKENLQRRTIKATIYKIISKSCCFLKNIQVIYWEKRKKKQKSQNGGTEKNGRINS